MQRLQLLNKQLNTKDNIMRIFLLANSYQDLTFNDLLNKFKLDLQNSKFDNTLYKIIENKGTKEDEERFINIMMNITPSVRPTYFNPKGTEVEKQKDILKWFNEEKNSCQKDNYISFFILYNDEPICVCGVRRFNNDILDIKIGTLYIRIKSEYQKKGLAYPVTKNVLDINFLTSNSDIITAESSKTFNKEHYQDVSRIAKQIGMQELCQQNDYTIFGVKQNKRFKTFKMESYFLNTTIILPTIHSSLAESEDKKTSIIS